MQNPFTEYVKWLKKHKDKTKEDGTDIHSRPIKEKFDKEITDCEKILEKMRQITFEIQTRMADKVKQRYITTYSNILSDIFKV